MRNSLGAIALSLSLLEVGCATTRAGQPETTRVSRPASSSISNDGTLQPSPEYEWGKNEKTDQLLMDAMVGFLVANTHAFLLTCAYGKGAGRVPETTDCTAPIQAEAIQKRLAEAGLPAEVREKVFKRFLETATRDMKQF